MYTVLIRKNGYFYMLCIRHLTSVDNMSTESSLTALCSFYLTITSCPRYFLKRKLTTMYPSLVYGLSFICLLPLFSCSLAFHSSILCFWKFLLHLEFPLRYLSCHCNAINAIRCNIIIILLFLY